LVTGYLQVRSADLFAHEVQAEHRCDDWRAGRADLAELDLSPVTCEEVPRLRVVDPQRVASDVAGAQLRGRGPVHIGVLGARVDQCQQQCQLVGRGAAAFVDDEEQALGEELGPFGHGVTLERAPVRLAGSLRSPTMRAWPIPLPPVRWPGSEYSTSPRRWPR
jgi:hypothetical protein